jgi:polar amino acid transport system substrate-binding protein
MTNELAPALAPSGRLRIGLNYSNFLLVLGDDAKGEPRGIAPDLGRELARRTGLALEFVKFDGAGKLFDAVKSAACDVGFLGAEPQRASEVEFSPAYLEIPVTFLVPAGSPIKALADVDREGVRAQGIPASYDVFVAQKLEALAGLKPKLVEEAERTPGSRVLDGQVTGVQQAIGAPKGRAAAAKFLREFADDVKRSGFVARAIERHGVRGVKVAP